MPAIEHAANTLLLAIYLQPKASRDEFVGLYLSPQGEKLKVAITAQPIEGKANKHLIQFLAKQCNVAKSNITLLKGQLSRHKLIQINDITDLPKALDNLLNQPSE